MGQPPALTRSCRSSPRTWLSAYTVLFPLASLALFFLRLSRKSGAAELQSGGAAERRSGAATRGTSPTALGGRAGHAQSAGPLQLSE